MTLAVAEALNSNKPNQTLISKHECHHDPTSMLTGLRYECLSCAHKSVEMMLMIHREYIL